MVEMIWMIDKDTKAGTLVWHAGESDVASGVVIAASRGQVVVTRYLGDLCTWNVYNTYASEIEAWKALWAIQNEKAQFYLEKASEAAQKILQIASRTANGKT